MSDKRDSVGINEQTFVNMDLLTSSMIKTGQSHVEKGDPKRFNMKLIP